MEKAAHFAQLANDFPELLAHCRIVEFCRRRHRHAALHEPVEIRIELGPLVSQRLLEKRLLQFRRHGPKVSAVHLPTSDFI